MPNLRCARRASPSPESPRTCARYLESAAAPRSVGGTAQTLKAAAAATQELLLHELAASLEKDHGLDPDKILAMLRKGALFASGPDAFRLPKAFAGIPADGSGVPGRAARALLDLAGKRARALPVSLLAEAV